MIPCQKKNILFKINLNAFQNEFHILENRIDYLNSNLSDCAFNHNRLEAMFRKKHVPHIHAHPIWHTPHAHHAQTHTTHMLRCTHIHIMATKAISQDFVLID